jgi:hypothetical protein
LRPGLGGLELGAETEQRGLVAEASGELHPEGRPARDVASGTLMAGLPDELNSEVKPMLANTAAR